MMGGMFDPVHIGHLETARLLHELIGLDEVHMVPCSNPVHREAGLATVEQRCRMLEIASAEYPWMSVDRRECDRVGPSWTFITLASARAEYPDASISLMMGLDAFISLPTWYRWQELFELGHIIVSARPDVVMDEAAMSTELVQVVKQRVVKTPALLHQNRAGNLYFAEIATPPVSSTDVRIKAGSGAPLTQVLPQALLHYIHAQQLYR